MLAGDLDHRHADRSAPVEDPRPPRPDLLVVVAACGFVAAAIALLAVGPEGRAVVDLHRLPTISKRDVIVAGLLVAAVVSIASRSRFSAVRRLLGLGFVAIGAAWMLKSHPYEGPVVATVNGRHGIHRNDWLAVFPALLGVALVVPWRRARRRRPLVP
jgi:hypothetical protein